MTRQQHLHWAKARALTHLDEGGIPYALKSMILDIRKHAETANHPDLLRAPIFSRDVELVRHWIEGFF